MPSKEGDHSERPELGLVCALAQWGQQPLPGAGLSISRRRRALDGGCSRATAARRAACGFSLARP
eukprot:15122309-Alexandrium_andersonii.AAC.1